MVCFFSPEMFSPCTLLVSWPSPFHPRARHGTTLHVQTVALVGPQHFLGLTSRRLDEDQRRDRYETCDLFSASSYDTMVVASVVAQQSESNATLCRRFTISIHIFNFSNPMRSRCGVTLKPRFRSSGGIGGTISSQPAAEGRGGKGAQVRARAASFGQQPHQIAKHKSKTGFVGLKNMGCICYMNSTLQQVWCLCLCVCFFCWCVCCL